jgi:hypothetical protein
MEKTVVLPVIPRNVADRITELRRIEYEAQDIAYLALKTGGVSVPTATRDLREIPFETLILALSVGYEVAKSPEEVAEEKRQAAIKALRIRYSRAVEGNSGYGSYGEDRAFTDGIRFTLDILGIEISEVNA